jgi:hypothetical protein
MDTEENIETPIIFNIIKIILYIIGFVILVITFLSIINYLLDIYYYIKELIITNENLYDVYSLRLKDINNYRLINYIKMFNEKSDDKIIKFNNEEDKCYDIKNLNFEKLEKATHINTPVNILEYDFNKLLEKNIEFSTKLAKIIKDKQVKNNAITSDSSYTDNLKKEASKYFDTTDAAEIANIWSVENIELDEEDFSRLSDQDQKLLYSFGPPK